MLFNIDFHYLIYIDGEGLEYISEGINSTYQMPGFTCKFWNRHPDLTLLAII